MTNTSPLLPGQAITQWAMAAPKSNHFPGVARPMVDKIDYRFVNGWVDTGDFPCRDALFAIRQENDTRDTTLPDGTFSNLHLTGESTDADFSQFCHRPTLIQHYLRCRLAGDGPAQFTLSICGGVRIWLDDALVASFQPFTRNLKQTTEITLPLVPEGATLTVELEDLHERDTTCFMSLIMTQGRAVSTGLPAPHNTADLGPVLQAMSALRLDQVFYTEGPIKLICDSPLAAALRLTVAPFAQFPRGGITGTPVTQPDTQLTLTPDAPVATIAQSTDIPQGCVGVTVSTPVGAGSVSRHLGTTVLSCATPLDHPTLEARKAAALAAMNDAPSFEPAVALGVLAQGAATPFALAILNQGLMTIEQRFDCCDFTLLPFLRILRDHGDALPTDVVDRLRAAVLNFRYWLDMPGDDVMWFWSENHVACFHIGQLIGGTLFCDDIFSNSGLSGAALAADATARLHRWFDSIEAHGLGEWNSAAYYPIDMLALLSLHDMTTDARLKSRAAHLLDQIFVMTALHTTGGVPAGSQGRAYEKELLAGHATELGSVAAIAFGGDFIPGYNRAAVLFCLSDYTPPSGAAPLARPTGPISARYTQGLDHLGKLSLYKTPDVQLSTVNEHRTGHLGHQQHVIDVQCAAHPMARLYINHPGEVKEWGERRPSLLAGNAHLPRVAQHGPWAAMIYDLPENLLPFTQLFAPHRAFDHISYTDGWMHFVAGPAHIAVWCSAPLAPVTTGQYQHSLHRAMTRNVAWLVAVDTPATDLPTVSFANNTLRAHHGVTTLELPFDGALTINAKATPFAPLTPTPHLAHGNVALAPWTPGAQP